MNLTLRLFIVVLSLIIFSFVIRMLVKRNLNESNSVMWLLISLVALISGFFPDIISRISFWVGIDYPPALLFLLAIIVLLMIIFKNSMDLSKSDAKTHDIASTLSILREENAALKSPLKNEAAKKRRLLVCIPAYNEGENIGGLLDELRTLTLREEFDILVIDDGSSDNTRAVCMAENITVITHIYNLGYGMALKTAYKYAADNQYEYIIQMDADGQHDIKNVERIYKSLTEASEASEAGVRAPDIVIGSRFVRGSVGFYIPFHKKTAIAFFRLLIKIFTKNEFTDPTSGLQGLNRKAFVFYAKFNNFAIDYPDANMIIQMLLNDFVICEIPAVMHARVIGKSMHHGLFKMLKYFTVMTISVFMVYIRESSRRRNENKKNKNKKNKE